MYFTSVDVKPTLLGMALTHLKGLIPPALKERVRRLVERLLEAPGRASRSSPGAPRPDAVKVEQA